ncbi:putative salicylate hydroxylase [Tothia fuscella]|uniref:Salicylate hydroxylase n=1 Tax=Tothia fuscella TaxID=1048955 RepID=A0A9P4NJU1_9PEZI|nr:putative salicylate hydroxylase [Tothia fuscella]
MSPPRIAIVGAGPAGLTLELRSKPTPADLAQPIGVLDLHEESGLAAIRELDLYDEFLPLTGDCAEVMRLADKDGNILSADDLEEHGERRPEISRNALYELLMGKLPEGNVKWDRKLLSATNSTNADGSTEISLDFGTHGKETFDLVIGADGAWSKVRKLLTDVNPLYQGTQIITLTIRDIPKKHPHLVELIGPGSFAALENRNGIAAQRGGFDSARLYVYVSTPDSEFAKTSGFGAMTAVEAKSKLLNDDALFGTYGPVIKELLSIACDEETAGNPGAQLDIRAVYGFPIGHTWEHKQGATLIGDAAHLMPPSGERVNIGMRDAVMLSKTIKKAYETLTSSAAALQKGLDALMVKFEEEMASRSTKAAKEADELNETMFGGDHGAVALADMFKAMMALQE